MHCGAYGKPPRAKQVAEIVEQGQAVHNREIHAFWETALGVLLEHFIMKH